MPSAWEDESSEPSWGDTEGWRGDLHDPEEGAWAPEPGPSWESLLEQTLATPDDDLLDPEEEDWCPEGWLEDWGDA